MLAKAERLPRGDFARYFSDGKRFHTPELTLIYTSLPTLRAAVVVSKKVAKKAHERNTIRRRIYAGLAKEKRENGLTGVVIIMVKPPFATLPRSAQATAAVALLGLRAKGR